jgi:hypothetical protein
MLAESGMTAFGMETVESCRWLRIVPPDLLRLLRLVELRPAWGEFSEYRYQRLSRARARKHGDLSLGCMARQ